MLRFGWELGFLKRFGHQQHPPVARGVSDLKRRVPHAQPGVASLLDIARRASKSKYEKISQALLGGLEIVRRIHAAEDFVVGNAPIEGCD